MKKIRITRTKPAGSGGGTTGAAGIATKTDANVTTTSTTFVDMTGMSITITTAANRVLLTFSSYVSNSNATSQDCFDFDVDGTRQGTNIGGLTRNMSEDANAKRCISLTWITNALTAASHTFKTQWRVDGATGTLYGGGTAGAATQLTMTATEII